MLIHDLQAVFASGFARARRVQRIIGLAMLPLGATALFLPLDPHHTPAAQIGLAAACVALGVWQFSKGLQRFDRHPFVRQLRERPAEVVWCFLEDQHLNGGYVGTSACLGRRDGQLLRLTVPPGRQDAALALLQKAVPHARAGYDPALKLRFKADPGSLASA